MLTLARIAGTALVLTVPACDRHLDDGAAQQERLGARYGTLCEAARHNPASRNPDGLPYGGETAEARVRSVFSESLDELRADFPGAVDIRVVHRDGNVWTGDPPHNVAVEHRDDYEIAVVLSRRADCPDLPQIWHGIPLLFAATE